MKWNWDFLRNRRIEIDNRFRRARPADKTIVVNGHEHVIQGAHLSDMEVAGRIRMLMRGQLDHESVCTLARDRIVYLADRLGEIDTITTEDFGRAIFEAAAVRGHPGYKVEGFGPVGWEKLPEAIQRYHVDLGAAVLALITGKSAPDPVEAQEAVLKSAGTAT